MECLWLSLALHARLPYCCRCGSFRFRSLFCLLQGDLADESCWPHIRQNKDPNLNVVPWISQVASCWHGCTVVFSLLQQSELLTKVYLTSLKCNCAWNCRKSECILKFSFPASRHCKINIKSFTSAVSLLTLWEWNLLLHRVNLIQLEYCECRYEHVCRAVLWTRLKRAQDTLDAGSLCRILFHCI